MAYEVGFNDFSAFKNFNKNPNRNYGDTETCEKIIPKTNINNPLTNYQEICNEICLLNSHLSDKNKYCRKCIHKHLSTIAGYIKEAKSLDSTNRFRQQNQVLDLSLSKLPMQVVEKKVSDDTLRQRVRTARRYIQTNILKV